MGMVVVFRVMVAVLGLVSIISCDMARDVTTTEIDPSGHLYRGDYLDLRERNQPLLPSADDTAFPPIPETSADDLIPPPPPMPAGSDRRVSVTVTDTVPLRDVLIELARDAKVNLELDPRIQGGVIFTAYNQPFNEVLKRICAMAGLRSTYDGNFIHIEMDEPYQQTYQLDFLSLARHASSETSIATNVFDVNVANSGSSGGNGGGGNNGASASENNSTSKVSGSSEADLWSEVTRSVSQILASNSRKADKEKSDANFSMDKQAGLVTVYGDQRQQNAIDAYFKKLRRKAYSQVLIDARIIEVELDDAYKSGINWSTLFKTGLNVGSVFTPAGTAANNLFTASYKSGDFSSILNLVRSFGTTRVLSAPRLTVLNNQTAILKVATNQVYFVTQAQFTTTTNANGATVTSTPVYSSTPHTVPVGLVMTVQPAIDAEHGRVSMTLRPTISRVVGQVNDPSIGLNASQAGVSNPVQSQIPVLAVREMDSVIRLRSGEVAVMGGLMQDSSINQDQGVPGLDNVPIANILGKSRDNQGSTSELVILLRATIADAPPADNADSDLYERFGKDPRPLPTRSRHDKPMPLPKPPANDDNFSNDIIAPDPT